MFFVHPFAEVCLKWAGIREPVTEVKINQVKTLLSYGKPFSAEKAKSPKTYKQIPDEISQIFDGDQLVVFGVFPTNEVPTGVEIVAESPDGPLSININVITKQIS